MSGKSADRMYEVGYPSMRRMYPPEKERLGVLAIKITSRYIAIYSKRSEQPLMTPACGKREKRSQTEYHVRKIHVGRIGRSVSW